jgi:hypothetical protein
MPLLRRPRDGAWEQANETLRGLKDDPAARFGTFLSSEPRAAEVAFGCPDTADRCPFGVSSCPRAREGL